MYIKLIIMNTFWWVYYIIQVEQSLYFIDDDGHLWLKDPSKGIYNSPLDILEKWRHIDIVLLILMRRFILRGEHSVLYLFVILTNFVYFSFLVINIHYSAPIRSSNSAEYLYLPSSI